MSNDGRGWFRVTGYFGAAALVFLTGCTQTELTKPKRAATEQLLISTAADRALAQADFSMLVDKKVFVEKSYIDALDEDRISDEIENDLRDQIAHNLEAGVLTQTAAGEIKYSWRGMIYLWCQFLLDLVRL